MVEQPYEPLKIALEKIGYSLRWDGCDYWEIMTHEGEHTEFYLVGKEMRMRTMSKRINYVTKTQTVFNLEKSGIREFDTCVSVGSENSFVQFYAYREKK